MTKHVAPKEVSIRDLAQTIIQATPGAKDSIIDYLSMSEIHLKDVRSLHSVLKKKDAQSDELLGLLQSDPMLQKLLNDQDRRCFYYGYVKSALVSVAVKSIYFGLQQAEGETIHNDVTNSIRYLSQACASRRSVKELTTDALQVSGVAKDFEHWKVLMRPYFFITDERIKGKRDALLDVTNKLKSGAPVHDLALVLIGIWFQTKKFHLSFRRIRLTKSVWNLKEMLETHKKSNLEIAQLSKVIGQHMKDIMHSNIIKHS